LREPAAEFVEDAGFVALEAGDADEAVALLEARSDIAVLFTAINMRRTKSWFTRCATAGRRSRSS
jgi:hypothetical protein